MGDVVQDPRDQAPTNDQHQGNEGTNPDERDAESAPDRARLQPRNQPTPFPFRLARWLPAHQSSKCWDENERQDHDQVLDDEPAHRNAPALGLEKPPLLQDMQNNHSARHREGKSEDDACPQPQPKIWASPKPRRVTTAICPMAPGTAMLRRAKRSFKEKCSPTPNMSRMTPISASCGASAWSATKPGVNGPTRTPAT